MTFRRLKQQRSHRGILLILASTFVGWALLNSLWLKTMKTQTEHMRGEALGRNETNEQTVSNGHLSKQQELTANRYTLDKRLQIITSGQGGGAFVHIGKTGGSTLSMQLRNGCHSFMPHPCRNVTHETLASRRITSYYHVPDFGLLPKSYHDFYVVTTRDPVDRFISSFVHEHLRNRQARQEDKILEDWQRERLVEAYKCFPTLESFVRYLEGDSRNYFYPYHQREIFPTPCRDFARAAFHGKVRLFQHIFFGYQRIKSLLPTEKGAILFVTRQEHLLEDWTSLNTKLGQTETIVWPDDPKLTFIRDVSRLEAEKKLPVTRDLSARGMEALCKAMEDEYESYLWFLQRSTNLSPSDIRESMSRAYQKCPRLKLNVTDL